MEIGVATTAATHSGSGMANMHYLALCSALPSTTTDGRAGVVTAIITTTAGAIIHPQTNGKHKQLLTIKLKINFKNQANRFGAPTRKQKPEQQEPYQNHALLVVDLRVLMQNQATHPKPVILDVVMLNQAAHAAVHPEPVEAHVAANNRRYWND